MKIAIIDIETTDVTRKRGLIVEIGVCELDLETGEIKKLFDELIREIGFGTVHTDSWIFHNSSLKFGDVMKATSLKGYRAELQFIFDCYHITAYNKRFDFGFLRDRGFKIERELPCPMVLATNHVKAKKKPSDKRYKFPKEVEAWKYYFGEHSYEEEHRGYLDAVDEAKIIYEMYKRGEYIFELD